jgi:hypothetical protein
VRPSAASSDGIGRATLWTISSAGYVDSPRVPAALYKDRSGLRTPQAAIIVAATLIAFLHHHRWAWMLLLAFDSLVLASFARDWAGVASLSLSVLHVAVLLSPQIRRYASKPVMLTA